MLSHTVRTVALLNAGWFGVEVAIALAIGSVALLADSIDFLEDACLNLLVLLALGWGAAARARLGVVLAALLLLPGLTTLWMAWNKVAWPVPPDPLALTATGAGALLVNLACALLLARVRRKGDSLTRAAFLSARNDVLGNAAIIVAGLVTALAWASAWPDLIVGLGIAALNAGAAWEVFAMARRERRAVRAPRA